MDAEFFEKNKCNFLDADGFERVFQFKKFIPWFRMFKKFRTDMRSFNHTTGWKKNISKYLNGLKEKDIDTEIENEDERC